jgi:hypothetical protein
MTQADRSNKRTDMLASMARDEIEMIVVFLVTSMLAWYETMGTQRSRMAKYT